MDSSNVKPLGYNASLDHRIQIQNTIATMNQVRDGQDIRTYSASARKELLSAGTIDIMKKNGKDIISVVPKLALVVVSSQFRDYLSKNPEATSIKITQDLVDDKAVGMLMGWVKAIIRSSDKRFGVGLPIGTPEEKAVSIIRIRHAAHALGMEPYVTHFIRQYKADLRQRMPPPDEVATIECLALKEKDDLLDALGERLGYLRRTGKFTLEQLPRVQAVLDRHPKVAQAVVEADQRAEVKRASFVTTYQ